MFQGFGKLQPAMAVTALPAAYTRWPETPRLSHRLRYFYLILEKPDSNIKLELYFFGFLIKIKEICNYEGFY